MNIYKKGDIVFDKNTCKNVIIVDVVSDNSYNVCNYQKILKNHEIYLAEQNDLTNKYYRHAVGDCVRFKFNYSFSNLRARTGIIRKIVGGKTYIEMTNRIKDYDECSFIKDGYCFYTFTNNANLIKIDPGYLEDKCKESDKEPVESKGYVHTVHSIPLRNGFYGRPTILDIIDYSRIKKKTTMNIYRPIIKKLSS